MIDVLAPIPGAATRFIGAEKYPACARDDSRTGVIEVRSRYIGSFTRAFMVRGLEGYQAQSQENHTKPCHYQINHCSHHMPPPPERRDPNR